MPVNPEVDEWFESYDNSMKDVVQAVRSMILEDERITETIQVEVPDVHVQGQHGQLQSAIETARQPHVPHRCIDPR